MSAVLGLVADARPRCGPVTVVALDGPSGSGKTTLGRALAQALRCPLVHMDELYPGWDGLAASVGILTTHVLEPLARGEHAAYPVWDWAHGRWGGTRDVPVSTHLVVEGCGCSVGPAGTYAAVRVWVEAPRDERLARGLARDGEAYRPHWERWAAQEQAVFRADGTRERADLVVQTGAAPLATGGVS